MVWSVTCAGAAGPSRTSASFGPSSPSSPCPHDPERPKDATDAPRGPRLTPKPPNCPQVRPAECPPECLVRTPQPDLKQRQHSVLDFVNMNVAELERGSGGRLAAIPKRYKSKRAIRPPSPRVPRPEEGDAGEFRVVSTRTLCDLWTRSTSPPAMVEALAGAAGHGGGGEKECVSVDLEIPQIALDTAPQVHATSPPASPSSCATSLRETVQESRSPESVQDSQSLESSGSSQSPSQRYAPGRSAGRPSADETHTPFGLKVASAHPTPSVDTRALWVPGAAHSAGHAAGGACSVE